MPNSVISKSKQGLSRIELPARRSRFDLGLAAGLLLGNLHDINGTVKMLKSPGVVAFGSIVFKVVGILFSLAVTVLVVAFICWLFYGKQITEVSKKGIVTTWSLFGFIYRDFYPVKEIQGIVKAESGEFEVLGRHVSLFGDMRNSIKITYKDRNCSIAHGLTESEADKIYELLIEETFQDSQIASYPKG